MTKKVDKIKDMNARFFRLHKLNSQYNILYVEHVSKKMNLKYKEVQ